MPRRKTEIVSEDPYKIVVRLYREGYNLGKICRETKLDVASVLNLLRKKKLKKKILYKVFDRQSDKSNSDTIDLFLKTDLHYLEKFFPNCNSVNISSSYYWMWKLKHDKVIKKRKECPHKIRHIKCACCGEILGDASHIHLDRDNITVCSTQQIEEQ